MRRSASTLESETTAAELSTLLSTVRDAHLSGPHLEIGTAAGGTLKELMKIYPDATRPPFVVVDPLTYFPDQRQIVERNLTTHGLDPKRVDFRVGFSWPALQDALARKERFSFVFIDGNHKAKYVMQDLAWLRMLEPGGLVALHDYHPKFRGVIWAVERFLRRHPGYEKIAHVDSMVILRKNAPSDGTEVSAWDIALGGIMNVLLRFRASIEKRISPQSFAR
jgi:predicted O-methyltransferase YrrM